MRWGALVLVGCGGVVNPEIMPEAPDVTEVHDAGLEAEANAPPKACVPSRCADCERYLCEDGRKMWCSGSDASLCEKALCKGCEQ